MEGDLFLFFGKRVETLIKLDLSKLNVLLKFQRSTAV